MIEVTVIIPAKNEEACIGNCIESINRNEYPSERYEVIVVDNGSSDSTVSIAKSHGAEVAIKPGVNVSALRNLGASMAKGSVLAFIDADCTVASDWLAEAEKYFKRDDVVCFGSTPGIPDNPTWVQRTWALARLKKEEEVETAWLESMNMFVKKEFLQKIGGFNERLETCEDVDISYRLSRYGRIISDTNIRAVHHGEARDIREFFVKEKWRGKGNYPGIFAHALRIDEMPSVILPFYFALVPALAFVFYLIGSSGLLISGLLILWQMPVIMIAYIKTVKRFELATLFRMVILYNVYYLARLSAIL
ncbi:MAG: hypothetical protein AMK71_08060 [Nitrospira bacterium SG8_35_4]|nr:MAG: hypothetical protein AMK71_08060 [Nitrospira bacterium SG8_35_4]